MVQADGCAVDRNGCHFVGGFAGCCSGSPSPTVVALRDPVRVKRVMPAGVMLSPGLQRAARRRPGPTGVAPREPVEGWAGDGGGCHVVAGFAEGCSGRPSATGVAPREPVEG